MKEIWKTVKDYPDYKVSNKGIVVSTHSGKEKKIGSVNPKGYTTCAISSNGKRRYASPHILAAEAFIPNPENKRTVNHKDGNKLNNNVDNLEWATYSENHLHAYSELGRVAPNKGRFGKDNKRSRPVRCIETGEEYDSITIAAHSKGQTQSALSMHLLGKYKQFAGHTWERITKN